jgi:hypothetical protein
MSGARAGGPARWSGLERMGWIGGQGVGQDIKTAPMMAAQNER